MQKITYSSIKRQHTDGTIKLEENRNTFAYLAKTKQNNNSKLKLTAAKMKNDHN